MILHTAELDDALASISLSKYTVCAGINQTTLRTICNHIAPKLECMLMWSYHKSLCNSLLLMPPSPVPPPQTISSVY